MIAKIIKIGDKYIGLNNPCYIIAEAGVNHGGDIIKAKELIDVASSNGADAVKFQSFKTESLILKDIAKADYQVKSTSSKESQFEMLKKLEITIDQTLELKNYCEKKNIEFLTTPFDEYSLDALDSCNLSAYKVSSTDLTNISFLEKIAQKSKPIILSTGMSYLSEVVRAVDSIQAYTNDLILLQCTANYPTPLNEVNLNVINSYNSYFDLVIGYSDHTEGIGASVYAVAMGAKVIEKHFTLDKNDKGPDHKASLNPDELYSMIQEVRRVELMMGSYEKIPELGELNSRKSLQKCLVANKSIKIGERLNRESICAKRTGGVGLSPLYLSDILGRTVKADILEGDIIDLNNLI